MIIVVIIIKKNQKKVPVRVTPTTSIRLLDSKPCDSEDQPQHGSGLQQTSTAPSQSNSGTNTLPDYLRVAQKMFPPSVMHSALEISSPSVSDLPRPSDVNRHDDSCSSSTPSFHSTYTNTSHTQNEALDEEDAIGASDVKIDKFAGAHSSVSIAIEHSPRHTESHPSNLLSEGIEHPFSESQARPDSRGQITNIFSKTPNVDPLRAPIHSRLPRPSVSSANEAVPPKPRSLGIATSTQLPSNKGAHSSPSGVLTSPHSSLPPLRRSPRQYPNSTAQGKLAPITSPVTPLKDQEPLNKSPILPSSDAQHQDDPHPGSRLRRPSVYLTPRTGQLVNKSSGLSRSEVPAPIIRSHLSNYPAQDYKRQPPQPTNNSIAQTNFDVESSGPKSRISRPSTTTIPSPILSSPESTINYPVQSPSDAKSSKVPKPISRLRQPSTPSHNLTSTIKPRVESGMSVQSVSVNPEVTRHKITPVIDSTLELQQQQAHFPTETNSSSTTRVGGRSRLTTHRTNQLRASKQTQAAVKAKPLASLKEETPTTNSDTEHLVTPPVKPKRTLSTSRPRARLPPRKLVGPNPHTCKP